MRSDRLILSCEHATARVPPAYEYLFASTRAKRLLNTHRGFDVGALRVARAFERHFATALFRARVTRLLVDTNRSLHHPGLFSEFSKRLSEAEKRRLLQVHYFPYRQRVEAAVRSVVTSGQRAVHLSLHSFTPRLAGNQRCADVGFLYDPGRLGEVQLVSSWRRALLQREPWLNVRRNYPYRGVADGLTRVLRRSFHVRGYVGLELEVNQRFFAASEREPARRLLAALVSTLPLQFGGVVHGNARRSFR